MMPWLIAVFSTAICLLFWFRDVRRIMRARKSTLESAARQVLACRKKADGVRYDPELAQVLLRCESIYQQGIDLYNQTLNKLFFRLPAKMMGFQFIQKEEYLVEMDEQENAESAREQKSGGLSMVKEKLAGYIGSVRFFKNLILLAVIILITIPTILAFRFGSGLSRTEKSLRGTQARADELAQEVESLTLSEKNLQKEIAEAETEHREELAQIENQLETVIAEQEREKLQAESPYASLYPDFYAPQELSANTREAGVMYLTFDDGPSARTREVLDILKKKDVKATFFVVGSTGEEGEALLRRIVEEGHTLGMHSYSHNYSKIYASTEDYLADMYRIFTQIRDTTGFTPTLFRFPGGSINGYNSAIYQDLIAEMMRRGFVPFDWNVSSADASERPVEVDVLVSNVISGARKVERGVVLMHDSAPRVTTVQALETMIDSLRAMGFELKALTPDVMPLLYAYRN